MKFNLLVLTLLYTFLSSLYISPQARQTTIMTTTTITTTAFDSDGHEVQPGSKYYISPIGSNDDKGGGGGLSLASRGGVCPPFVIQENTQLSRGLSLRFLPLDSKQSSIALSSDLNIVFNAATICVQSTVWRLSTSVRDNSTSHDNVVAAGRRYYVRSGGVVGRPGVATMSNWFRIEKVGDIGYKFVFCPSVCGTSSSSSCKGVVCGDVGVLEENGKKWLALIDNQPFVFTFKKA